MKTLKIKGKEIKVPIVQGGMGVGISLDRLASSVIKEGAIGTISASQIGFSNPDFTKGVKASYDANVLELRNAIKRVKEKTDGFLAINILTASRTYDMLAKTAVEEGADAIVSGAGLPLDLPKFTKGTQTAAIPIVSSSRALNIICKRWKKRYDVMPDAIIVEGPKAGGHLGIKYDQIATYDDYDNLDERFFEVKKYCEENNLDVPIIVAGGIFSNSDVKRYFDIGVDGVQIGTRFIATEECDADIEFKKKFVTSQKEDIVYVKSPVGYPARAIRNDFTEKLLKNNIEVSKCLACVTPCKGKNDTTPYCITEYLVKAVQGDVKNGLVFSGSNGYRISEITTVKLLLQELTSLLKEYKCLK